MNIKAGYVLVAPQSLTLSCAASADMNIPSEASLGGTISRESGRYTDFIPGWAVYPDRDNSVAFNEVLARQFVAHLTSNEAFPPRFGADISGMIVALADSALHEFAATPSEHQRRDCRSYTSAGQLVELSLLLGYMNDKGYRIEIDPSVTLVLHALWREVLSRDILESLSRRCRIAYLLSYIWISPMVGEEFELEEYCVALGDRKSHILDLLTWKQRVTDPSEGRIVDWAETERLLSKLCPWLMDLETRRDLLVNGMQGIGTHRIFDIQRGFDRANLYGDAYDMLLASTIPWRERSHLRFQDLETQHAWFTLLSAELTSDTRRVFIETYDGSSVYKVNADNDHFAELRFAGKIIAHAILYDQKLPILFSDRFYKFIASGGNDDPVDMNEYEKENPVHAIELKSILAGNIPEGITFTAGSAGRDPDELIPGGSEVRVDDTNRHRYVQLLIEHNMHNSIVWQMRSVLEGFLTIDRTLIVGRFTAEELASIISQKPVFAKGSRR